MSRRAISFGVVTASLMATAALADATGDWLVADGTARISIADCAGALWGVASWEAAPGGVDEKNPDPAKRSRPILAMPVLIDMKASGPNQWAGQIYNSDNGKTYSGALTLISPHMLRVRGCVFAILCGAENWTRAELTSKDRKFLEGAVCSADNRSR